MSEQKLVIIPTVTVWTEDETLIFDRKFYDGILMYIDQWDGTIACIMRTTKAPMPAFGLIRKKEEELPFDITVLTGQEPVNYEHFSDASIILAPGDAYNGFHLSTIAQEKGIKCVYVIEYIPETRYQIVNLETNNPIIKLRRHFYIWNGERKRLAAFKKADGLQANGSAAYNLYKKFNACMVYFDSRINSDIIIKEDELNNRLSSLSKNLPLRLAFSGRLIKMKGADHLIELAQVLKSRNVEFHMTIYGAGDLESYMAQYIKDHQLDNQVEMTGAVDFYEKLVPDLKANIDLFVILHRQSDPSCTYLETMSCGIPIVGYQNKAFSGLLEQVDIGWGKEIDDLHGVADIIEQLNMNREEIKLKSRNCLEFSQQHDFEKTSENRIKHLQDLLKT